MAGYREHISVSGLLGVCYGAAGTLAFGFTPDQGALAACLAWVAGMIPDLDSQTGRPVRELFGLVAALAPLVLVQHLVEWGGNSERILLLGLLLYVTIRYGGATVLGKLAVHRGMFHSIPALLICAETVFLVYRSEFLSVRFFMAGGVTLGFLSHLILDEMYSVEWTGVRIRLNKSAGSAMKMFSKSLGANAFAYGLLSFLTYASLVHLGWIDDPLTESAPPAMRQAVEDAPVFR